MEGAHTGGIVLEIDQGDAEPSDEHGACADQAAAKELEGGTGGSGSNTRVLAPALTPLAATLEELTPAASSAAAPAPLHGNGVGEQGQDRRDGGEAPRAPKSSSAWGVKLKEFEVTVDRGGSELGIDVHQQREGEVLLISRIKIGPIHDWNCQNEDNRIMMGDQIVAVNGARGTCEAIIGEIRTQSVLKLQVRRLLEFGVSIRKEPERALGLDVAQTANGLKILKVNKGPFRDWNTTATEDMDVRRNDMLVEANGTRGQSSDLLAAVQAVQAGGELHAVFMRPPHGDDISSMSPWWTVREMPRNGVHPDYDPHSEDDLEPPLSERSPSTSPDPSPENSPRGGHLALRIEG